MTPSRPPRARAGAQVAAVHARCVRADEQMAATRARMPGDARTGARPHSEPQPVTLTLPEPPSANRWWRHVGARVLLSREAREYKAAVAVLCMARRLRPIAAPAPVRVDVTWYRGRKAGDLDKRLGVLLDALQGTAYESDAQVAALSAERIDRPREPGVAVTITPMETP